MGSEFVVSAERPLAVAMGVALETAMEAFVHENKVFV